MKANQVSLGVWEWDGVILVGGTSAKADAWVKDNIGMIATKDTTTALGWAMVEADHPWVIWLRDLKDVSVLAHEALHVVTMVLRHRGLKLDESSEESYTYMLGFIVKAALKGRYKSVR